MDDLVEGKAREDRKSERHRTSGRAWEWIAAAFYTISLIGVEERRHWHDPVTYLLLAAPLASLVIMEVRRKNTQNEPEPAPLEGEELVHASKGLSGRARRAFLEERGYYASPACGQAIGKMASTLVYFAFYIGSLVWVDVHDNLGLVRGPLVMFGILALLTAYGLVSTGVRRHRALSRVPNQGSAHPPEPKQRSSG